MRRVLLCVAVCCSVLQCVAVCCSLLQCVAVCCGVKQCYAVLCSVLQCVAVCCSVLQSVAICLQRGLQSFMLQCVAEFNYRCVAGCFIVLHFVAVHLCPLLRCVVCCHVL